MIEETEPIITGKLDCVIWICCEYHIFLEYNNTTVLIQHVGGGFEWYSINITIYQSNVLNGFLNFNKCTLVIEDD